MADGLTRLDGADPVVHGGRAVAASCPGAREESVHMALFPARSRTRRARAIRELLDRWTTLTDLRERVLAEIEPLRKRQADRQLAAGEGRAVGHAAGAAVPRSVTRGICRCCSSCRRSSCGRRRADVDGARRGRAPRVTIERAGGVKCERCWRYVRIACRPIRHGRGCASDARTPCAERESCADVHRRSRDVRAATMTVTSAVGLGDLAAARGRRLRSADEGAGAIGDAAAARERDGRSRASWISLTSRNTGAAFGILNASDFPFKTVLIAVVATAALVGVGMYAASLGAPSTDGAHRPRADHRRRRRQPARPDRRPARWWISSTCTGAPITSGRSTSRTRRSPIGVAIMILDMLGVGTHVSKTA